LQVSPVNGDARGSNLLLQLAGGVARECPPAPGTYLEGRGRRAQARDLLGEAEPSQGLLGVGGEQQAGADHPELGRALEHDDLEASPAQRYRGRQPTDTGAGHNHFCEILHVPAFPARLWLSPDAERLAPLRIPRREASEGFGLGASKGRYRLP
jgi:hypothetical protein